MAEWILPWGESRGFEMGRFSSTPWTGPTITSGVLVRERQKELLFQRECDDEVGVGLMWPEVKECWQGNRFSLTSSRRMMMVLSTPGFSPGNLALDLCLPEP